MVAKEKGQASNDLFFVEVSDPREVRKNILETLRQILTALQRFERFNSIRSEKLQKIEKLRLLMRESHRMMNELKGRMPQASFETPVKETIKHVQQVRSRKKGLKEEKEEKSKPEKPKAQPTKKITDLERLESELSAIEGKLKSLA